jgi:hypothetical protein
MAAKMEFNVDEAIPICDSDSGREVLSVIYVVSSSMALDYLCDP